MKTNWRSIGTLAGEVMRRAEKIRAAASDGARPDEEVTPGRPEGGGTVGRAPTQVDHPLHVGKGSRSADKWTIRPPRNGRGPKAPAASNTHVKEPGLGASPEPVLPASVDGKDRRTAPKAESPTPAVRRSLLSREDAHQRPSPVSQSISAVLPARAARQPRMQIAMATTHQTANKKRQTAVVALMP